MSTDGFRGPRAEDGGQVRDTELLRAYADEKSEAAFGELVRRHVNLVYSSALRQCGGDAHLAEDVAQKVFTDFARKARQLSGYAVLGGWLYRSAQFAASDVVRAERRRRAREQEASAMHETLSSNPTAGDADWQKLAPVLDQAIGELAAPDRDAVVLRFFESRPFAEIGATLRLTEDAARMRVERALDKLRVALVRRGITSTAAALGVALANQVVATAPAGLAVSVTGAALSGAAASGAMTAALVSFMSTTKIGVGVAGVIALLAVGVGIYQNNSARESAARLVSVSGERDVLRARLAAAEKQAGQLNVIVATAKQDADETRRSASNVANTAPARIAATQGSIDYVLDHPEKRAAFVQQEVVRAKGKFERFFLTAGLSAEQQEKFLQHLKNNAEARLDLYAAERAQGYGFYNAPQSPETYQQFYDLHRRVRAELWENMRGLLGDAGAEQYTLFSLAIPNRNTVDQLAGRLYDTNTPLTARQADQVVELLGRFPLVRNSQLNSENNNMSGAFIPPAAVEGDMAQAMVQGGMTNLSWHAPVSDLALADAQTVLTPKQLAGLRGLQEQQVAQLQLAPPPPLKTPEIPKAARKTN